MKHLSKLFQKQERKEAFRLPFILYGVLVSLVSQLFHKKEADSISPGF